MSLIAGPPPAPAGSRRGRCRRTHRGEVPDSVNSGNRVLQMPLSGQHTFIADAAPRPSRLRVRAPRHPAHGPAETAGGREQHMSQVTGPAAAFRRWLVRAAALSAVLTGGVLVVGGGGAGAAHT